MSEKSIRHLSSAELSAFCAQLSLMLKAGIPVPEGLDIMAGDAADTQGRELLTALKCSSEAGEPLARCFSETGAFPRYMVDMTALGEASGRLEQVMDSLCEYYEREEALSRSIRGAVTYPLIMVLLMLIVITVLVVKVLPMFCTVYEQLGSGMDSLSSATLRLGSILGVLSMALAALIAAGFIVFAVMRSTESGRRALARLRSRFFLTKKLSEKISSGRIASALSLAFASGIEPDEAIKLAARVVDDPVAAAKLDSAGQKLNAGASFSDALTSSGIFSGIYSRMAAVGFRAGSADKVMAKLAERYDEDVDSSLASVISVLEPSLVAVLSIVVGMILLSVMTPLIGIMSSIG